MSASVLPEMHESEATPDVAAVYGGLRAAMGVPLVNLIWRHFATLPGVLPWAWEATRGVIGSGTVAEGLARMAEVVRAEADLGLAALGPPLRALPPEERSQVAGVVRIYNRGNEVNLQVLSALRRLVAGDAADAIAAPPPPGAEASLPPVAAAVPPLPRMDALPDLVRAEVAALAALHDPADPVVPSLYRHLALWPGLLAPLHAVLAPRFREGRIDALRGSLLGLGEASALALLPRLTPPGPFPAEHRDAVLRVLAVFPGKLIAEMAAVGLMLEAEFAREGA